MTSRPRQPPAQAADRRAPPTWRQQRKAKCQRQPRRCAAHLLRRRRHVRRVEEEDVYAAREPALQPGYEVADHHRGRKAVLSQRGPRGSSCVWVHVRRKAGCVRGLRRVRLS